MIRQRFVCIGFRDMNLDTQYGRVVATDHNIKEFCDAMGYPLAGQIVSLSFFANRVVCYWATYGRNEYVLHPFGMIETEKTNEKGTCPKCGHAGTWVRMALKCPEHGVFGGC